MNSLFLIKFRHMEKKYFTNDFFWSSINIVK